MTISVDGGAPISYGDIPAGATASQSVPFTVPSAAVCGSQLTVNVVITSSLGMVTRTFNLQTNIGAGDLFPAPAPAGPYPDPQQLSVFNGVGNHTFRATVVDNGEPGGNDQFGLRVTAPGGAIIPGLTFDPITLSGGNIQVPHQSSATASTALK